MKEQQSPVTVIAPARLHMGFIDLSGSLGRHFGSIGLALNEITTEITMRRADQCTARGPASERAISCTKKLCRIFGVSDKVEIEINSAIPEHVGLGSGTQMSLAIGMALSYIYGLGKSVRDIAEITDRGMRSGIGIGVFEQGGLVVDGGRGEKTKTPPVIAHMDVPDDWRFILVFDARGQGLHGDQEIKAFKALPPFPHQEAARLCYLLIMQGLPALAEKDIVKFGDVITQLQRSVGAHFASAQGGVFTSREVGEAMQWLEKQGAVALGQTSWGPTGFCVIEGIERAESLARQAEHEFSHFKELSFVTASARNSGGEVVVP